MEIKKKRDLENGLHIIGDAREPIPALLGSGGGGGGGIGRRGDSGVGDGEKEGFCSAEQLPNEFWVGKRVVVETGPGDVRVGDSWGGEVKWR